MIRGSARIERFAADRSARVGELAPAEGARTPDPLITNQVHYQLCYAGIRRLAAILRRLPALAGRLRRRDSTQSTGVSNTRAGPTAPKARFDRMLAQSEPRSFSAARSSAVATARRKIAPGGAAVERTYVVRGGATTRASHSAFVARRKSVPAGLVRLLLATA